MLRHVVGIVSGGSSGLGAATARHILQNGGRVVVADLGTSKEGFFKLASSAGIDHNQIYSTTTSGGATNYTCCASNDDNDNNGDDGRSHDQYVGRPILAFCETDVTISDQVSAALDLAEDVFSESVNAAISCAGIAPAKKTLSKDRSPTSTGQLWKAHPVDVFSRALDVNVIGTFNVARLSAERMMKRDLDGTTTDFLSTTSSAKLDSSSSSSSLSVSSSLRGCIINTASIAAFEGQIGQVAYAASKGAIVGMTLPMARDLAPHGIRVMTIVSNSLSW
jgi:3-hydroxyacyl-CoA dehydrogenase/3-hydroxy-2-methylbutyryl-CoA dehydrogenase